MNTKYELLPTVHTTPDGAPLFQLRALRTIGASIRKGDKGGLVTSEYNLSEFGDAWVSGDAQVSDKARVSGDAQVSDKARVSGDAQVSGKAWVSCYAQVSGDARVSCYARVSGDAWVSGKAWVSGDAWVSGKAWVSGDARVSGYARVSKPVVNIIGLYYNITIYNGFIQIGCQGHTCEQWFNFTDAEVRLMDGKEGLGFWLKHRDIILNLSKAQQG